jgi:serine/threonine protein kinase
MASKSSPARVDAESPADKKKDWWAEAKTWVQAQGFDPCQGSKAGKGSFGSVYPAQSQRTGLVVAVKFSRSLDEQAQEQENATLRLLAQNPHPNVVRIIQSRSWGEPFWVSTQISELAISDLHYWLRRHVVDCDIAARFARDLASGVEHLHRHDVEHRDLKPSNLMLFSITASIIQLRIGDFGSCRPPPAIWTSSSRRSRSPSVEPGLHLFDLELFICRHMYLCMDVFFFF